MDSEERERIEEAERKQYEKLCAELDSLLAENARLRAALKPFADVGNNPRMYQCGSGVLSPTNITGPSKEQPVLLEDCRRAAELLKEISRV